MIFLSALLAIVVLAQLDMVDASLECHSPLGIGDGSSGISSNQITELLDGTTSGNPMPYLFLPLAEPLIGEIVTNFETPIQFRQALYHANGVYSVVAMYHATALDTWGLDDKRICIEEFSSDLELKVHQEVASAYAFAYSAIVIAPTSKDVITSIMDNVLKLPMSQLSGEPDVGTPWGLAKATIDQLTEYSKSDGWNYDGHLANDFNAMPFCDFDFEEYSAYQVSRTKNSDKACKKDWNWEPLLETDGNGYFTRQEHVTPFVGYTGRLYGLNSSEYENFSVPAPKYDYCEEATLLLSRTKEMASDDKKKASIEFFDSKFTSILPLQIGWSVMNRLSLFDFWYYDVAIVTAMYDATMLVWREKVAFNAVRPTTVVAALRGEEKVESYAGPYVGAPQMVKGVDWKPYIRTMPVRKSNFVWIVRHVKS